MTFPAEKRARLKAAFEKARQRLLLARIEENTRERNTRETLAGSMIGSSLAPLTSLVLGAELYMRGMKNVATGLFSSAAARYLYDLGELSATRLVERRFDAWIEKLERDER